jgi:hypothetical protein
VIKLLVYTLLNLAALGCLLSALTLGDEAAATMLAGLVGGALVATVGMGALLIRERIRGRCRERAICIDVPESQALR